MAQSLRIRLKDVPVNQIQLVGIVSNGVYMANRIHEVLIQYDSFHGLAKPMALNVSLYRDDISTKKQQYISISASNEMGSVEDAYVVMCDDVVSSGRTARAALNAIFDYGRPASVDFLALYDRMHRELPIQPSIIGQCVEISQRHRLNVEFCEVTGLNQALIVQV